MSLSGTQITGTGVIGFPGKTYPGFTAKAESINLEIVEGFTSILNALMVSLRSTISTTSTSKESIIIDTKSMVSILSDDRTSLRSTIIESGESEGTEL